MGLDEVTYNVLEQGLVGLLEKLLYCPVVARVACQAAADCQYSLALRAQAIESGQRNIYCL